MDLGEVILLAASIAVGLVLIFALQIRWLLFGVLVARALCDYGTYQAAGQSMGTHTGKIAAGLAIFAIVAAIVRAWPLSSAVARRVFVGITCFCLIWFAVGFAHFGFVAELFNECLRLPAIAAVAVLASASYHASNDAADGLALVGILPAAVLIFGFATRDGHLTDNRGRAFGTFSHPNAAVVFLVVAALVALAAARRATAPARVAMWWSAAAVLMLAAATTESLAGLAGLAIGVIVLYWVGIHRPLGSRMRGLVVVVSSAAAAILFVPSLSVRIAGLRTTESLSAASTGVTSNSLDWRFYNWEQLIGAWRAHRWIGYGLGTTSSLVQPGGNLPHSVPLQLLVETGVVGSLALASLWVWALRRAGRVARAGSSALLGPAVFASLIALSVDGLASNLLGYTAGMYMLAALFGAASRSPDRATVYLSNAPSCDRSRSRGRARARVGTAAVG